MPMTSRFDKLNNLSMDYSKYFGEMALTDEQKKQRIAFSKQMEDVMLFLFELLDVMADFGSKDEEIRQERNCNALFERSDGLHSY